MLYRPANTNNQRWKERRGINYWYRIAGVLGSCRLVNSTHFWQVCCDTQTESRNQTHHLHNAGLRADAYEKFPGLRLHHRQGRDSRLHTSPTTAAMPHRALELRETSANFLPNEVQPKRKNDELERLAYVPG